MNAPEPATWQESLELLISNPRERARLVTALHVRPITLQRWIDGTSRPREENMRLLIKNIPIEFSFGTETHESFYHDLALAFELFEPLVVKTQLATSEEWRDLSQKGLAEMYEEDFCAAWMLLTVWGTKPL